MKSVVLVALCALITCINVALFWKNSELYQSRAYWQGYVRGACQSGDEK